jgi:nitroreductase
MSTLLDKMQWRYAAKKMDASKVVPQEKVDRIVEAARLAPTSSGLQPLPSSAAEELPSIQRPVSEFVTEVK